MGATIDPVTGMPNISGPEIDQITLGTQTFPWDDLKADGRPTRPSSYSDDLIPTTSIIVGQREADRNQVKIPTVTDDRRLRVDAAITSGGGGGGGSPVPIWNVGFDEQQVIGTTIFNNGGDAPPSSQYTALLYAKWHARPLPGHPPGASGIASFHIDLIDGAGGQGVSIANGYILTADYSAPIPVFDGVIVFNPPLLVSSFSKDITTLGAAFQCGAGMQMSLGVTYGEI